MITLIVSLNSKSKETIPDKDLVGGKGHALLFLMANGMKVPRGFIITSDEFHNFLLENGLAGNLNSTQQSKHNIIEILIGASFPETLNKQVLEYLHSEKLESASLAVRSSANVEDASSSSFAGQFKTVLNVNGEKAVLKAIKTVYSSAFTKKITDYCKSFSVSIADIGMAVVIQELINGDVSGVMFTQDPITGKSHIVIEAVVGLNEGLVSGRLTPSRFIVDAHKERLVEAQIKGQNKSYQLDKDGIAIKPNKTSIEEVLNEEKIIELASKGITLQRLFGSPQDVEWTIKDGVIYFLQSRPITAMVKGETAATAAHFNNILLGYPGSAGIVEGEVVIVIDPSSTVAPDKILVFKYTDTDFVPLMKKAKAIITDEGGMLSHAAVISRELGIPAVVGVKNATKSLKTGQKVYVNGGAGLVSIDGKPIANVKTRQFDMSTLYCLDTMLPTTIDGKKVYYEILPEKLVYYTDAKLDKNTVNKHFRDMGLNLKARKGWRDKFFIRDRWEVYKQDPAIETLHKRMTQMNDLDIKALSSFIEELVAFGKTNVKHAGALTNEDEIGLLGSLLYLRRAATSYLLLNTVLCEGYGLRLLYSKSTPLLERLDITFPELLAKIGHGGTAFAVTKLTFNDGKLLKELEAYYKIISEWRQKSYSVFMEFGAYSEQIIPKENKIVERLNSITGKTDGIEYWYPIAVKKTLKNT